MQLFVHTEDEFSKCEIYHCCTQHLVQISTQKRFEPNL